MYINIYSRKSPLVVEKSMQTLNRFVSCSVHHISTFLVTTFRSHPISLDSSTLPQTLRTEYHQADKSDDEHPYESGRKVEKPLHKFLIIAFFLPTIFIFSILCVRIISLRRSLTLLCPPVVRMVFNCLRISQLTLTEVIPSPVMKIPNRPLNWLPT